VSKVIFLNPYPNPSLSLISQSDPYPGLKPECFQIGIVGRATLKMMRRKSKTQFVKQERNTQNVNVLLNYLKCIAPQQLMLRTQVFTKNFLSAKNATATFKIQ
jgi:hypothetical protein